MSEPNERDDELLSLFVEESREHLAGIEGDLLSIEAGGAAADTELVNKVFRAIHSVKGAAGFFGLNNIKRLAHAMENVLGQIRKNELVPTQIVVTQLLDGADSLSSMIADIQGSEDRDVEAQITQLERCLASSGDKVPSAHPEAPIGKSEAASAMPLGSSSPQVSAPEKRPDAASISDPVAADVEPLPPLVQNGSNKPAVPLVDPVAETASKGVSTAAAEEVKSGRTGGDEGEAGGAKSESIRVHLGILDRLMTLAGELVLTRNQLMQAVSVVDDATLSETTSRIDHITTELQDAIMSTRMQSIGIVFHKFRRVVRDLSKALNKDVRLTLEGEDVELDRNIIEAINDPLTHLVRNALDHGIETPGERKAAGKPSFGTLRLSAFHKAGHVIIEIEDDGRGIDPQKIKRKALSMGLLPPEQLEAMSDQALVKLIFRPGFSTATEVTDVSGRGVGMDVVNVNLSRLGGVVDVDTNVGKGTRVTVKLPLTLAIIPCLLVSEENENFAIPQANLVELHRIPAREVKRRIEQIGNVSVMRLRGDLLPLARLRDVLKMDRATYPSPDGREPDNRASLTDRRGTALQSQVDAERRQANADRRGKAASAVNIAIVAAGDFHFGLIVESLQDSAEIVVKPLGRHMRECREYAGATILGNGQAALILDVVGISRIIRPDEATEAKIQEEADAGEGRTRTDVITLLLAENGGDDRFAVPLGLVERIERIHRSQIEHVAGLRTMKYRGRSLLLFSLDDVAKVSPLPDTESLFVIVFRLGAKEVGLLVANILDIVDSTTEIDDLTFRQIGVFGSLIIDNNITLLVDLHGLALHLVPRLSAGLSDKSDKAGMPSVLVVDDSEFFRNKIREFFEEAGHRVITAVDGVDGMNQLERYRSDIGLVVTDIEMPQMDGFEMTRRLRMNERNRNLPVIAVTSVSGEEAERRGKAVGIDDYLIKLDRNLILERSRELIRSGRTGAQLKRGAP